jgi:hypothetical protein
MITFICSFYMMTSFAMGSKRPKEPNEGAKDVFEKYYYVDTKKEINRSALKIALGHYDKMKDDLENKDYLTVIDFSKHSGKKRFYLIDMNSGVVDSYHTAHGSGGDPDHDGYVNKFSNVSESKMSSLGLYMTAETYSGSHGHSLRLDGLSSSNSNARKRAIVIHGADYVDEGASKMGRSWGCPALSMDYYYEIIETIKGGSLIYAYHP